MAISFDRQQRLRREVLLGLIPEREDTPEEAEFRRRFAEAVAKAPEGHDVSLVPDWDSGYDKDD